MLKAMRKYIKETENLSAVNVVKILSLPLFCLSCRICDKTFYINYDVEIHEKIHKRSRKFKCTKCGKELEILASKIG